MQKIIFKDNSELVINSIVSENKYVDGVYKEFYNIDFYSEKTFEEIRTIFTPDKLGEFSIYGIVETEVEGEVVQELNYQGTHFDYNELCNINYNNSSVSFTVQITKPNMLENIVQKINDEVFPTVNKNDLNEYKVHLIKQSKKKLEEFLATTPMQWIDGKRYSTTKDKQTLLANALQIYQMKVQAEIPATLLWNATGEECTEWEFENLCGLALAIAEFVEPRVSKQQTLEIQITNAETIEELNSILIDYEII